MQNLKTFLDLVKALWRMFLLISSSYSRLDLYQNNSIKGSERNRRKENDAIITFTDSWDQPLPNDMKKFWPLSENKVAFQRKFIQWVKENGKCMFLGRFFYIIIQKFMSTILILSNIFLILINFDIGDIAVGLDSILKVYFLDFVGHTCADIHNSDRIYRSMLKYYIFK